MKVRSRGGKYWGTMGSLLARAEQGKAHVPPCGAVGTRRRFSRHSPDAEKMKLPTCEQTPSRVECVEKGPPKGSSPPRAMTGRLLKQRTHSTTHFRVGISP
jgi:hypothetical protein